MKMFLQPRRALNRSEAWSCVTANVALPGSGSLVAGRPVGYAQMILALIGLGISMGTAMPFVIWVFKNWSTLNTPTDDPIERLQEIWGVIKWPVLGLGVFALSFAWAGLTSFLILREVSQAPPKL